MTVVVHVPIYMHTACNSMYCARADAECNKSKKKKYASMKKSQFVVKLLKYKTV